MNSSSDRSHQVDRSNGQGLGHVVVAGGTPAEWLGMSVEDWRERLTALARGAGVANAHWVTVLPHHGQRLTVDEQRRFASMLDETGKVAVQDYGAGSRFVWRVDTGLSVVVDPDSDGHERFAAVVESLRAAGVDPDEVDEDRLSAALLAPATEEPDLVIVLGPPDVVPSSMVWELAYSELVFLDLSWGALKATHLELAIDDFNRRHRRFGGLDS